MPGVQFYHMPASPPCRVVEMVAELINVKLHKHPIDLMAGEQLKDDYVKLNPLHKVPFIVDGDLKMGESRAIVKYLVSKYKPDDALYPAEPRKRAAIDELLFYDVGTLYAAQLPLFKAKIFGGGKQPEPEQDKALRESLQYLDQRIGQSGAKFMTGNQLTIADISIVGTLDFSLVIDYDLSEFKNLLAYRQRVKSAIPNYAQINEPMEDLKRFVKSKQEAS